MKASEEQNAVSVQMPLDAKAIMDLLPHRYPFLLVDRVTDFEAGQSITALKKDRKSTRLNSSHGS
mgnify:CR=1 FL=1